MIRLVAVAAAVLSVVQAANPVSVTVYYESLCPDSIKFYVTQLYPTMEIKSLSNNIDLSLVPYGKSEHQKLDNGSWSFKCHHGERECYGNKVHACALKLMTSKNERLTYLNCLMKNSGKDAQSSEFPAGKCAEQMQIAVTDKDAIIHCATSAEGDEELAAMGNKTTLFQPKLTSVPTVVFNGTFNQNDQNQAQTNFKGVLCKYFVSPKPAECAGTNSGASLTTSIGLLLSTIPLVLFSYKL